MTKTHTMTNGRMGFAMTLAVVVGMSLLAACTTVSINPEDGSSPQVRILRITNGGVQEVASVNYSNDTVQEPLQIFCSIYDPQGIKSADLRVSDTTVSAAYCGGGVYSGNYEVDELPPPSQSTGWVSPGTTRREIYGYIEIAGILPLATNPPSVPGTCYPAGNTSVTVRCQGKNWSSNGGTSTTTKYLQVNF